ncbi:MAG: PQQ-dependent sugar dehydrogenase [Candidatus Limnocylindria bacterium]
MKQPRRCLVAAVLGTALAACSSTSPTPTLAPTPIPSPGPTASPVPPSASSVPTATPAPTPVPIADNPPPLALETVASGFRSPIGIATAPGGWLLVNERYGRVVAIDPATGETAVTVDISSRVLDGGQFGEQGLLGLVLHPDWPATPRAFLHYTDRGGDTVISEFAGSQDAGGPPVIEPGSERVILALDQPYANHNGGQLAFGPDGYLYVGLGDGGSGGDPQGNGQNPDRLLGKILRLDVAEADGYAIPAGNPFASGNDGAPEAFLVGLRNPWRFSFDRATGLLWIGDVGQNAFEEIDRIDPEADAGANLGWNLMEANHCYAVNPCPADRLVLPVAEYGRDLGCSVTGGYVYRGEAVPDLRGWYLFSDYCTGILFGVRSDASGVNAPHVLLDSEASVSSFGEATDGELYVADIGSGAVYRIGAGD